MKNKIPFYLLQISTDKKELTIANGGKFTFLDKTIINSAGALKSIYLQAENAGRKNPVHNIHPHIKLLSMIYLAVMISIAGNLHAQFLALSFIFLFYVLAGLRISEVYRKIFFPAFIFGFLIVWPASLNIITPGKIILSLVTFKGPHHFWIYNIPAEIGFTAEGCQVVTLIFLRVINSVSLAMLIVYTTSFPSFIKSFKIIGVPDTFLMIVSLAYKFIFILSRTIEETYFALKSRLTGRIKSDNLRRLIGGRIFFIFKKSMIIYENTYFAMVSRGYRGKVILHSQTPLQSKDFVVFIIVIALGISLVLI